MNMNRWSCLGAVSIAVHVCVLCGVSTVVAVAAAAAIEGWKMEGNGRRWDGNG